MRAFLDTHTGWLTVVQLPAYAPDLNAAESVWSPTQTQPRQRHLDQHRRPRPDREDQTQTPAIPPRRPDRLPRSDRPDPQPEPTMITSDPGLSRSVVTRRVTRPGI